MQTQQRNSPTEQKAPPVRSWRLLLLILLVLLPVTVALASPEPVHFPGASVTQHETGGHTHHPSDTPVCHHAGHHAAVSALVTDNREAELPTPADSVAAIPGPEMPQARLATGKDAPFVIPADHLRPAFPVYLRTLRLRV
ncbi:hypothetical protein [Aquisalimonas sp.]|uniref:hypothetical protein n=1 Tax=unclassified Aquisalimonas TaxID=2644645 RepID=UPI0025C6616C|nr:hypothetical protein [Aquisalimonas sp.]